MALPVWFGRGDALLALALTAGGVYIIYRWRVAVRQKRQLADPDRAASVPPLKRHVATTRERGRRRREAAKSAGYLLVPSGLLVWGLVVQAFWFAFVAGLLCLLFGAAAWHDLARWRRIRYVERRSSQPVQTTRAPRPSAAPRLCIAGPDNTTVNAGPVPAARSRQAQTRPSLEVKLWPPGLSQPIPNAKTLLRTLRTLPGEIKTIQRDPGVPTGLLSGIRELTHERNFAGRPALRIGYFRLFDNDPGIDPVWAKYGYVPLLRSSASVTPEEEARMKKSPDAGTVFITSAEQLARDTSWRPAQPVYSYPVRALLCHSGFWKTAVDLLLPELDLVFVSLSGYHHELHEGTGWELQRIIDRVPIHRVVLLTDTSGNRPYIEAQVRHLWSHMADASPNAGAGSRTILVVRTGSRPAMNGAHALFRYIYERLDRESS